MLKHKKQFRRFIGATLVTSVAVGGVVAVSAATSNLNVEEKVSNDLQISFSVANIISTDFIALTWGDDTDAAKQVNTNKDDEETISYNINPGESLNGEQTIAVVLEIPTADTSKIDSIKLADGTTVATSFTVDENTYYVLKEDQTVSKNDNEISSQFNITFSEATDTDISANIFAVADHAVQNVINMIDNLPTALELTVEDLPDLLEALEAFGALTSDQKTEVTNADKLEELYARALSEGY
jgi:hypothetical protein